MKKILIILYLLPIFLSGQITQDTFDSQFFGFDFWSSNVGFWGEVYQQMEDDTFPFDLVGSDAINWQKLEPNPPHNGIHQYNWSALDPFMKATQKAGKVLELGIRPLSNWGTIVKADDVSNWALGMSPILPDEQSDTANWGMTAQEAWYDFMYSLIERYNNDGDNLDAPWLTKSLIHTIVIGNEPESPSHFFDNGGSMKALHQMLKITKKAINESQSSIILARGKSNSGRLFDDAPDMQTIMERGGYYLDSLMADFDLGADDYDVFAINYNDHYLQLPTFVQWLKAEMSKRGFEKPFIVGDARTTLCPRDNFYNNGDHILPPVYSNEFMQIMENPDHPKYEETKDILQRDEVMQSIKKILMAAYTGQQHISLQPVYSSLETSVEHGNRKYMWYYSGFFDPYIYDKRGDLALAREPVYWAMKQLVNLLVGSDRNVEKMEMGDNNYVFKFTKNGESFFIVWHEDNKAVDAATGLRKRNQNTRIDLSDYIKSDEVKIEYFAEKTDENGYSILNDDAITKANIIEINEFPVIIVPANLTNTFEKTDEKAFKVYPNPFDSEINIEFNNSKSKKIQLFDQSGQALKTVFTNGESLKINTINISAGIYFLKINNGNKISTEKVVKVNNGG